MTRPERLRDSANASDIPANWPGAVGGYLPGGDPYRVWHRADWARFPGRRKLPIFVQSHPESADPAADAFTALRGLFLMGARPGCLTALDLEGAIDPPYVLRYGAVMRFAGFKVLPYGEQSTIFKNPPLDGRWVAWYRNIGPFMAPGPGVAMTQYADPANGSGGPWDSSTIRWATWIRGPWWR
jgi:hypothetical protein